MSNSILDSYRKHYVSEKVRLKRLKKEAKQRNCKVILQKARLPVHNSCVRSTEERDQQVPNITDIGDTVPPSMLPSSNQRDYKSGVTCETDRDARNIFQSIKSLSGFEQPSTNIRKVSADSLLLIDLGSSLCKSTKEYAMTSENKDVKFERTIKQDEPMEEANYEADFEEDKEHNWCPLTPMSEPERDTLTPSVSDDGMLDSTTSCTQHNGETQIAKMPLIKECWSLAGKNWSYSSDSINDYYSSTFISESDPESTAISSNCNANKNIYMESDSEKQTSKMASVEILKNTKDELEAISCVPAELSFHQKLSVNVNSAFEQSGQAIIEGASNNNLSKSDQSNISNDLQETSDSSDNYMMVSLEESSLSQMQLEKSLNTQIDPQQHSYGLNGNGDLYTDIETNQHIVTPLTTRESDSTIKQLISTLVDRVVSSEKTQSNVIQSPSPSPPLLTEITGCIPQHDVSMPVLQAISQEPVTNTMESKMDKNDREHIEQNVNPVENGNPNHNSVVTILTSDRIQEANTTNASAPELGIKESATNKPDEYTASLQIWDQLNINTKRKRGRPKGRGRGRKYGSLFMRQAIPYQHMVYNMNNLNTINNMHHIPNHQGVNVPVALPSKGVIGMVSPATYSEIQKHQSTSEHIVPKKVEQNQPAYQAQPMALDGGILVPIYELVNKTIPNVDNQLQTATHHFKIPQTAQTNGTEKMIELQRPPPTYQSTMSSKVNAHTYGSHHQSTMSSKVNAHTYGSHQTPVQNKLPSAVNQHEINGQNRLQLGNESVLALPRNAVLNMPVPISIPKTRYTRKGSNIKTSTLTVREQLREKMRGKISERMNSGSQSPQAPPHLNVAPRFQMVPTQPTQLPLPPPLMRPPTLPLPTQPPLPLPPPLTRQPLPPQPPQSLPQPPPLQLRPPSIQREGTHFSSLPFQHSNPQQGSHPFPVYLPSATTYPPVSTSSHSFVAVPQYSLQVDPQKPLPREMMAIVTNQTTVLQNAINYSYVSAPAPSFSNGNLNHVVTSNSNNQTRITGMHNLNQQYVNSPIAVGRLQAFANLPQQETSALDLSMPSKKLHNRDNDAAPLPEVEPVPLDLSRKSAPIPAVKCTPLDLSKKGSNISTRTSGLFIQNPNINANEGSTNQVSISVEPLTDFIQPSEYYQPEQNLSVLAAAAEMLEARSKNTASDIDPRPSSPKMSKILVKFNPKRKLWHLVPNKAVKSQTGKMPRRGRPPIIRKIPEPSTGGKTHNCQFCDFSHSQKGEVRIHIKLAHFAKFKKDPKTNNLRQVDHSLNKEDGKPGPKVGLFYGKQGLFQCKSCDFKAKARYLLQRHVIKWHPNKTSYMCQSKDCAQMFQTMELLREHQLIHKKNQKYICSICGASYHYMNGLRAHDARHHSLLAYPCSSCGLKFKSQGMLQRHQIQKNHFIIEQNTNP